MAKDKSFYLRMPEDVRSELEKAYWRTQTNRDEILLQGFAIWLLAERSGSLAKVLDKAGYLPKHHPDREKAAVGAAIMDAVSPAAESNGQEPEKDPWDLDSGGLDRG